MDSDIEDGEGPVLISDGNDQQVLDMGWPETGELMKIPNEADRLLIAAAPDLLSALQSLLIQREGHFNTEPAWEAARAAIAKATGTP